MEVFLIVFGVAFLFAVARRLEDLPLDSED